MILKVFLKHTKNEVVESAGVEMGGRLRQYLGDRILGPDKPAVARVKAMNIRKIVIKLENGINQKQVRDVLHYVQNK